MWFFPLIASLDSTGLNLDNPPGRPTKTNTTHLDVFMLLFLLCTLEVVICKIITYDQENEMHGTSSVRRSPMAMFFDRDWRYDSV